MILKPSPGVQISSSESQTLADETPAELEQTSL